MFKDKNKKNIDRRNFLKLLGGGAAATTAVMVGCDSKQSKRGGTALSEIPTDQMTYRTSSATGDVVSLLGYGCMRLPTLAGTSARDGGGSEIDQEMVNELTDYALAHGINYFDTSPAYCQGQSEKATGIALSRHPRDSYFIATKLSNFAPNTWSREASIAMYNNSMKELQVDYIDYMLLHAIGLGGMDSLQIGRASCRERVSSPV